MDHMMQARITDLTHQHPPNPAPLPLNNDDELQTLNLDIV